MSDRPLIGCDWHDGADVDACGCPALDSPGAIAYRGLLVKARAEIARLAAELAAARAAPADVEARIALLCRASVRAGRIYATGSTSDGMACDEEVDHEIDYLRAAIARAIADARRAGYATASGDRTPVHAELGVSTRDATRAAMEHGVPCPTCGGEATPPPTVGGLLATHLKEFRTGTVAIECFDGEFIGQFIYVEHIVDRCVGGEHQQDAYSYCTYRTFDEQWVDDENFDHVNGLIDALAWPARLVPTAFDVADDARLCDRICDRAPATRGPLPKGG